MSRNNKELEIAGKKVTVFELTVRQIKKLWSNMTGVSEETQDSPIYTNEKLLNEHWDECVHGIKLSETDDLTPSQLKEIYDAFSEVNAVFFDLALRLEGENPFLKLMREALLSDLTLRFAALLPKDTLESGTTDTVSSPQP